MARRRITETADSVTVEAAIKADHAKTPMGRFKVVARGLGSIVPRKIMDQRHEDVLHKF